MGKGDNNEELIKKKVEPAIRYAEVLLIYAEALNELNGQYDIPSAYRIEIGRAHV